jgi:predicted dienelactone hydrolase
VSRVMTWNRRAVLVTLAVLAAYGSRGAAQDNRIDTVAPAAPDLAAFGAYAIGVRTIQVTDRNRPDILKTTAGAPTARYDRTLTLEVWYPASLGPGQRPGGDYRAVTRDPAVTATLRGRAVRDAAPLGADGPFPLVVISHGYPGNRYLMSHLGENLATKGYVAVSIDHADSTYDDQKGFASTLYNRPFDQLFVLNEMARLGAAGSGSFLAGRVDASRAGLVGYSMGGYGVVNVIGGGYRTAAASLPAAPPNRLLLDRGADTPAYRASMDARVKAAVAIGPWGMQAGFWNAAGLAGIRTPTLFVAGSADDVSGYEKGTRAIFDAAVNAERYLLTFVNANHNAAAPIPAPAETYAYSEKLRLFPFAHYADAVWDTVRMNNILAHFVTAHFDARLKGDASRLAYFDVVPNGKDAVFAMDRDGTPQPAHTYWKGFKRGTAVGLVLERGTPATAMPR